MTIWRRAVVSAIVLFATSACVPNIEEKDPQLGQEASADDVSLAVLKATQHVSLIYAQVGQSVSYEENYRIGMGGAVMTRRVSHELTQLTQDSTSLTCTIHEDYIGYFPSGAPKEEDHRDLQFQFKKGLRSEIENERAAFLRPRDTQCTCGGKTVCDDGDGVKYDCKKFYNLKAEARSVDAPELVQEKENCLGFRNCQIDGTYIEYDEVKYLQSQIVRRVRLMAHLSSEIPDLYYAINSDGTYSYTPAATSFCSLSMEQLDDHKYEVELCSVLRDVETRPSAVVPTPQPSAAPAPVPSATPIP